MYSKYPFPISMENIPRQDGICCLSLRFTSVFTALLDILYSLFALAQCGAAVSYYHQQANPDKNLVYDYTFIAATVLNNTVTFFLTTIMLIGALKSLPKLIRPWIIWVSSQLIVYVILFTLLIAMASFTHDSDNSLLVFTLQFMFLMVRTYMLILVASYYRQLVESTEEKDRLKSLVSNEIWYQDA